MPRNQAYRAGRNPATAGAAPTEQDWCKAEGVFSWGNGGPGGASTGSRWRARTGGLVRPPRLCSLGSDQGGGRHPCPARCLGGGRVPEPTSTSHPPSCVKVGVGGVAHPIFKSPSGGGWGGSPIQFSNRQPPRFSQRHPMMIFLCAVG